jgi:hypothetical protein
MAQQALILRKQFIQAALELILCLQEWSGFTFVWLEVVAVVVARLPLAQRQEVQAAILHSGHHF